MYVAIKEAGGETLTDDRNGNLVGNQGSLGTINYATGAYDVTFNALKQREDATATRTRLSRGAPRPSQRPSTISSSWRPAAWSITTASRTAPTMPRSIN